MKKIVASVGLVALGASGIETASAQPTLGGPPGSKPWSVSASLRGFYDDNVNGSSVSQQGSSGFELSPTATLAWSLQQTTISLGYVYSLKYYDRKPAGNSDHYDQTHAFNAAVTHAFSERFQGQVSDSFVIGQEPDYLRAGNSFSTFQRISGDNIRNYGAIGLDAQLTPRFGASVGYDNAYYDYSAEASQFSVGGHKVDLDSSGNVIASPSGSLDRIENGVHLEGLFLVAPETKGLVGYRFRDVDYTGDEIIGGTAAFGLLFNSVLSDSRNFREHVVYVGGMHTFPRNLEASLRVGASYTDYYNDPTTSASYSPYVDASVKWTYLPESYMSLSFNYDRNATDIVGFVQPGSFTIDSESAVISAMVNHRILPKLFGSVIGTFQNSSYNGGAANNESEQFYLLGLSLEYRFNPNFSAQIGYDYDKLESNIQGRGFDRNRVYMGLTASY